MRKTRDYLAEPSVIVHASNWGVNRGQIFFDDEDYDSFLQLLFEIQKRIPVSLLVYSLMPNQFDLVLQQHAPFAISRFMKRVCQAYAEQLNRRLNRTGHVFTRRYRGVPIPDVETLLRLSHSIHMSPVQAALALRADQWRYSSCKSYMSTAGENLADRSLIWAMVGGRREYARLMDQFDPARPASIREFLCSEAVDVWFQKKEGEQRGKQRPDANSIGARPGPGPPIG